MAQKQISPISTPLTADEATTLTNKTIDGNNNTLTVLGSQVVGNLSVSNFNSGTGADNTTFLRGDGTWVTPAGGGSGDMEASVYDAANISEQLAGLTAAQTLTNKTIDGNNNTLTVLGSQVVGNLSVSNFNSGTGADNTTFLRGDGTWATPAGGGSGDMEASVYDAANVSEQLAGLTAAQTLTNKTIDGNNNTLTVLGSQVSGNLSVSNFNSGTGADNTTFLRGDGTWAQPAGGGYTPTISNLALATGFLANGDTGILSTGLSEFYVLNKLSADKDCQITLYTQTDLNIQNVLALLNFNGTDGQTTTTDSSTYNQTVTLNSASLEVTNAPYGTAALKVSAGSNASIAYNPSLYLWHANQDYTIEMTIRVNSYNTISTIAAQWNQSDTSQQYFSIRIGSSGNVNLLLGATGTTPVIDAGTLVPLNTNTHVAVCKSGSTITLYINGVSQGTTTYTTTRADNGGDWRLGTVTNPNLSTLHFDGLIDDFAVYKVAKYNGNFTPPSKELILTPSLVTLLNFNGTDGQTTTTDSSYYNKTVTLTGSATLETTNAPYGTAALKVSGGATARIAYDSSLYLWNANQDWTIEMTVRIIGYNSIATIAAQWNQSNANQQYFVIRCDGSGIVNILLHQYGGSAAITASTAIPLETNTHLALCKKGLTVTLYINGVSEGTTTLTETKPDSGGDWTLGSWVNATVGTLHYNGLIDDFAVYKHAKYDGNFTPPNQELTPPSFVAIPDRDIQAWLEFEGSNGDTTTVDSSPAVRPITLEANGGTSELTNVNAITGTTSLRVSGGGWARIAYNTTDCWDCSLFAHSAWTVELRASIVNYSNAGTLFAQWQDGGERNILVRVNATGQVVVFMYSNVTTALFTTTATIPLNTPTHVAIVRYNNVIKVYLDGVEEGSGALDYGKSGDAITDFTIGNYFKTGGQAETNTALWLDGIVDDVIIASKALYTNNFTPSAFDGLVDYEKLESYNLRANQVIYPRVTGYSTNPSDSNIYWGVQNKSGSGSIINVTATVV